MTRFDMLQPSSLQETLEMTEQNKEASFIAGGTDLLLAIDAHTIKPICLIDITELRELQGIRIDDEGNLHIGAAVTISQIEGNPLIQKHTPVLSQAAGKLGSWQVRNLATIGGNLCNAAPSAETAPPLLALNTVMVIAGKDGEQQIPLEKFWTGPGETVLKKGTLLKKLIIPNAYSENRSVYLRHVIRKSIDISLVNIALFMELDESGKIYCFRMALGAVAPTPIRVCSVEVNMKGKKPEEIDCDVVVQNTIAESKPISDIRASAWYRRSITEVLARRGLQALGIGKEGVNFETSH